MNEKVREKESERGRKRENEVERERERQSGKEERVWERETERKREKINQMSGRKNNDLVIMTIKMHFKQVKIRLFSRILNGILAS